MEVTESKSGFATGCGGTDCGVGEVGRTVRLDGETFRRRRK
ncbi:hypothetical protein A2U01_0094717 [Trifolium medium]|uniref:Uncharacterized protein n=1 Tax=Trifolium medium TaxID=97028 RepID=A0A392UIK5_9FABA|nr:hypothetical protein [Trifolium medium]